MQISSNGITRLKREEGERLKAYSDSRGYQPLGLGIPEKWMVILSHQG